MATSLAPVKVAPEGMGLNDLVAMQEVYFTAVSSPPGRGLRYYGSRYGQPGSCAHERPSHHNPGCPDH